MKRFIFTTLFFLTLGVGLSYPGSDTGPPDQIQMVQDGVAVDFKAIAMEAAIKTDVQLAQEIEALTDFENVKKLLNAEVPERLEIRPQRTERATLSLINTQDTEQRKTPAYNRTHTEIPAIRDKL